MWKQQHSGTLFQNLKRLREDGIFLSDKNLRVAEDYASLGTPLWVLEDAKRKREPLSQRLGGEITAVAGADRQCIGVLSAENLADPKIAELFSGLDQKSEKTCDSAEGAENTFSISSRLVGTDGRHAFRYIQKRTYRAASLLSDPTAATPKRNPLQLRPPIKHHADFDLLIESRKQLRDFRIGQVLRT